MSFNDHERLSDIFAEAVELEPGERSAYLDQACRGDAELRAEVESLLAHHDDVPDVLETGRFAARTAANLDALPERIGPYSIVEKIGEGGMGIVYRAEQDEPIRRQVAIKQVKLGIETRQVIARFESERQALALMNHPNIARVLDAGASEDGRPFFAMEYVEGEPITAYCDKRTLVLSDRLELFIQVCEGVQHAHHNAIIHRDIKPSNILVATQDGRPVPKIIDFGVAKALDRSLTDRTMFTEMGQLLGTPEYMSPEQAGTRRTAVDGRTDVYSLGVLLYELVAGAQPFDTKRLRRGSLEEVRRTIRHEEPAKPSSRIDGRGRRSTLEAQKRGTDPLSLLRRLRGDLDWITMKALEKAPSRRYGSPAELAADLRRYINSEPVLAGPPSTVYRLRKFAAKHRARVGVASLILVLVLGSTITWAVQANRIAREARRASQEAATAEMVSEFVVGMFEPSLRIAPRFHRSNPGDVIGAGVRKIREELRNDPLLQARLVQAMGDLQLSIGSSRVARSLLEEGHARLLEELGAGHPMALNAANSLARCHRELREYGEAEPLYLDTLQEQRRVQGDGHLDTLGTMSDLAFLYKVTGRNENAEPLFREALQGFTRILGADDPTTLLCAGYLAGVQIELNRYDEAEALLLGLVDRMQSVLGNRHGETAAALYNLGCVYAAQGNSEEALLYLGQAFDNGFEYGGSILSDPHLQTLHGDPRFEAVARRQWLNQKGAQDKVTMWAWSHRVQARYDEAASRYRTVLEAMQRAGQGETSAARFVVYYMAYAHLLEGRYDEAEPLFRDGLEGARRARPYLAQDEADFLWTLALCELERGRQSEAVSIMREAVEIYERALPRDGRLLFYRAGIGAVRGEREGALRHLELAVDRGFQWGDWMQTDPALETLHGEPEFHALVEEVKTRFGEN